MWPSYWVGILHTWRTVPAAVRIDHQLYGLNREPPTCQQGQRICLKYSLIKHAGTGLGIFQRALSSAHVPSPETDQADGGQSKQRKDLSFCCFKFIMLFTWGKWQISFWTMQTNTALSSVMEYEIMWWPRNTDLKACLFIPRWQLWLWIIMYW